MHNSISIITVTYNAAETIEATLKSIVVNGKGCNCIVVDGLSSDNTIAIVNRYKKLLNICVLSEPDKGIYDAMNKGIALAKSNFVCFINSGDILFQLPNLIEIPNDIDLLCFPVKINNRIIIPKFNRMIKLHNTIPHQGCFYKTNSNLKYNLKYKIFSDYDLNLNFFKQKKNVLLFKSPIIAEHILDGVSNQKKNSKELFKVIKDNSGYFVLILSFLFFKIRGIKRKLTF